MPRLLFEKTGNAVWMSHLDLMRVFQRAFKRAGLPLTHTQGFNPRPSVSIALPLSVGIESKCELLDFDLDDVSAANADIMLRLNQTLVEGVRVLDVYDCGRKLKELAYLRYQIALEYDQGIPANAAQSILELFRKETLFVTKKTKNGMQDQDIIPMIRSFVIYELSRGELCIETVVSCQNPTLNPAQIISAISVYLTDFQPDFAKCKRIEVYDASEKVFR